MVKCLPAMPETQVLSVGRENPLEKEMATHSSILAWEIPWTEEPGGLQSLGSQRVRHNWATSLSLSIIKNRDINLMIFSSVQSLSRVRLFVTPWIAASQASLFITNSWGSLKLMSIESVMPYSHLILGRPLLLLPPIPPSIKVFLSESTLLMRWPKYWSFSFSIIPSKEHPVLISFRMDWLDLLAVQGTLKTLFQHHSSKASILRRSAFFTVQLSHPYMTTGKTIALTRQTFLGKVISLLLNMLSRLVITFLPRSKRLLISWLQSPSAVILEPKKRKSVTASTFSPSICHAVMRNAGLEEAQAGIKIARELSVTSDMQMTPPLWQKVKRN